MSNFYFRAFRKLNRLVQFGARLGVFTISLLAMLGAGVVALTQLDSFRSWLIGKGVAALNNELMAKVEIGDVTGNFITGLTLHDVKLITDSTTLLYAPEVELTYDLRPLFEQQVVGAKAYIHNPTIRLVRRASDSSWNFDRITKPAVDSIKTPFNWTIDVHALEIINGHVLVEDKTSPARPITAANAKQVDFGNLDLTGFNVSAQATIAPTGQSIWIQNLSFNAPRPDIRLVELAGQISIDTTGLTVKDLRLETGRTLLTLSGHLDSANVLGVGDAMSRWQEHPVSLDLDAKRVSTLELQRIVPETSFLGGSPSVRLVADGTFSDVAIKQLRLGLTYSQINITGRLRNLDVPDSVIIDAKIADSKLTYADVPLYVPGLGIPDLSYLGDVTMRTGTFSGTPEQFINIIDATTRIGTVRGGARFDLRKPVLEYAGDLAVVDADFAPIFKNPELKSDVTGRVVINGRGTTLDELDARVRLESQGSTFAGREYRWLYVDGVVSGGGLIDADTILIAWGPGGGGNVVASQGPLENLPRVLARNMETVLGSQLTLTPEARRVFATSPSLGAGGTIDLRNPNAPTYDLNASGDNVDISKLTLNPSQASNLTFTASVNGSGFDPDQMEGKGTVEITDGSSLSGQRLPATTATFSLDRTGANQRTLDLKSNIADAYVTGTWSFQTLTQGFGKGINALADYVARTASYSAQAPQSSALLDEPINAEYKIDLKDLSPLGVFLESGTLAAKGNLSGSITGSSRSLNMVAQGSLEQFTFKDGSTDLAMSNTKLDINLQGITPRGIEAGTTADITIQSDSLVQFSGMTFSVPNVRAQLQDGLIHVRGATAVNRSITLAADGIIDVSDPGGYRVGLDTLIVGLPDRGMEWRNESQVRGLISKGLIRIDSLVMKRRNGETVAIAGALAGDELRDVSVTLVQGSLRNLRQLAFGGEQVASIQSLSGLIREATVRINGTLDRPEMDLDVRVDSISYAGTLIGDFAADFEYANQNLTGNAVIRTIGSVVGDTAGLAARVSVNALPIDLALADRDERFVNGRAVDIDVVTNDLPFATISPFLPGVRPVGGTVDANFSVSGTFPNISYNGRGQLTRGQVIVEGNNILYYANASLRFEENVLYIERLNVVNDPREILNTGASITGEITFDGLSVDEVDIRAHIEKLLVLSDATQAVNESVYGDLVIASGIEPIHFYGKLDRPYLRGDVVVLAGDIRLPQDGYGDEGNNFVRYVDYAEWLRLLETPYGPSFPSDGDTTTRIAADTTLRSDTSSLDRASAGILEMMKQIRGSAAVEETPFVDLIDYDLRIFIQGRLFLTIEFGPLERLTAELASESGPLTFQQARGSEPSVTGALSILPGSEYLFIKKFDATGLISFTDDVGNPTLNITAVHDGRRVTDDGQIEEYAVTAHVTGTKSKPMLDLSYTIGDVSSIVQDPSQRQQEAISLLLFGRTTAEMKGTGIRGTVTALGGSIAGSSASAIASTALSQAFSTTGFIRSFDIDFGGDRLDFSRARVNVVSQFGKVVVRYGGQISSPDENTITVELPLGAFTDVEIVRKFSLQLQREVRSIETSTIDGTASSQTQTWRLRLQVRASWP